MAAGLPLSVAGRGVNISSLLAFGATLCKFVVVGCQEALGQVPDDMKQKACLRRVVVVRKEEQGRIRGEG